VAGTFLAMGLVRTRPGHAHDTSETCPAGTFLAMGLVKQLFIRAVLREGDVRGGVRAPTTNQ
jgi:hypothetical protein